MPEGVNCGAPCAFRSYNKYRQKKDGSYELSKLPGAGGDHGTCRHGTMIHIEMQPFSPESRRPFSPECLDFTPWDTLLHKPTDAGHRGG
jgi:hypothetical protein